jgi:hypothetical protein
MLKFSGFHFKKPALLSVAVLGLALISIDASAQSEQEKTEENLPRPSERVVIEEQPLVQDNAPTNFLPSRTNQNFKTATARKELPVNGVAPEKDAKKNESPSTLSFNIFLYVVDKFKAD